MCPNIILWMILCMKIRGITETEFRYGRNTVCVRFVCCNEQQRLFAAPIASLRNSTKSISSYKFLLCRNPSISHLAHNTDIFTKMTIRFCVAKHCDEVYNL